MIELDANFAAVIFASVILAVVTAFDASSVAPIADAPTFALVTASSAIAAVSTALSASSDAHTEFAAKSAADISSENVVGGLRTAI